MRNKVTLPQRETWPQSNLAFENLFKIGWELFGLTGDLALYPTITGVGGGIRCGKIDTSTTEKHRGSQFASLNEGCAICIFRQVNRTFCTLCNRRRVTFFPSFSTRYFLPAGKPRRSMDDKLLSK